MLIFSILISKPLYKINGDDVITEIILDHLKGFNGDSPVRIGNQG